MTTRRQIDTTIGALVNADAALRRVLAVKYDKDGGAKVRYHLVKLARLVAAETQHYYDERDALVAKHGAQGQIGPASPAWGAFVAELKPVAEIPVTIAWGPITDAMIEPYGEITAADVVGLGPLFDLDPFNPGREAT